MRDRPVRRGTKEPGDLAFVATCWMRRVTPRFDRATTTVRPRRPTSATICQPGRARWVPLAPVTRAVTSIAPSARAPVPRLATPVRATTDIDDVGGAFLTLRARRRRTRGDEAHRPRLPVGSDSPVRDGSPPTFLDGGQRAGRHVRSVVDLRRRPDPRDITTAPTAPRCSRPACRAVRSRAARKGRCPPPSSTATRSRRTDYRRSNRTPGTSRPRRDPP